MKPAASLAGLLSVNSVAVPAEGTATVAPEAMVKAPVVSASTPTAAVADSFTVPVVVVDGLQTPCCRWCPASSRSLLGAGGQRPPRLACVGGGERDELPLHAIEVQGFACCDVCDLTGGEHPGALC